MRIVHFADVHLDRPFIGMELEAARERRAGLRAAFDRCLELATSRGADLITIGGDLWEDEHVTPDTIRWVADRLSRAGRPVIVVAGNHDPLSPGGPFDRAPFGENVTVLGSGAAFDRVDVGDLSVWGTSWQRATPLTSRALRGFAVPATVAGTCCCSTARAARSSTARPHCPFTSDDVRARGSISASPVICTAAASATASSSTPARPSR